MKKGFTLIELLAVITLLGIIAMIAVPAISGILRSNRESVTDGQKKLIESAAKNWANANSFSVEGDTKKTVGQLQEEGYLDKVNMENVNSNDCVLIKYNSGKYTFVFKKASEC